MFFIISICWILIISYGVFLLLLWYLWNRIPKKDTLAAIGNTTVSVIIPVRNEEANIEALLLDLGHQNYPKNLYEVIIVDDRSEDDTALKVQSFSKSAEFQLKLIQMPLGSSTSPKKAAIETAIQQAKGDFIMATDGDCRVSPGWISTFVSSYEQTNACLISGPVTFNSEEKITDHLQTVEFSSLIGTGASCIQAGYPTMCNGANLGYSKKAFIEVGGYEGVREIASGDDEFLMHKISQRYPKGIRFIKNAEAIVKTQAHQTWKGFFNQRKRWASKWQYYSTATPKILAAYIFFSNAVLPVSLILTATGNLYFSVAISLWLLKCLPEWLFISTILRFLGKSKSIVYIPLVQLLYPFYILLFGITGASKQYEWKGRHLQ